MTEHLFLGLAGIIVLGIAAQWLAWYIRVPSIFLLLLAGFAVGPISGLLQPQALLGDLLFPIVSLSVAIILFEGGLSLRTVVLRDIGRVLRNLITIGVVSTWAISAAAAVARWLQVGQQNPQGVLFIGASPLSRAIAEALQAEHYATCLIDTNWSYITIARMAGLRTYYGNALTAEALDYINMDGIGRVLALTPNDEANALATLHFAEIFGRDETYQLSPGEAVDDPALHLRGRFLFDETANYTVLSRQIEDGAAIKTTRLSDQFDYEAFQAFYQGEALLLFVISAAGHLTVHTMDTPLAPVPGEIIISLIPAPILAVTNAVPDASDAGDTSPQ